MQEKSYYIEKSVGSIFSRRDFLKVAGVSVSTLAITGYLVTDVVKRRKDHIAMRQAGLYKDDKRLQKKNLANSHQNQSVMQVYRDLKTEPMGKKAKQLMHTHTYVDRTNLAHLSTQGAHHG